jgi:prophage regulatory protein
MKIHFERPSSDSGTATHSGRPGVRGSEFARSVTVRTIRRGQLHQIVPLSDTTIYEMEQRGEFPKRFHLTSRCVVWDLSEVEAWIRARRQASEAATILRAPIPDVHQRKSRPVKP